MTVEVVPNERTLEALIVAPEKANFIERDRVALEVAGVRTHVLYARNPLEITAAVTSLRPDWVMAWFLERHAFWAVRAAKARRIPTLLVLGGQEGAACRECGYGLWLKPWRVRLMARYALWNAARVWAVEPSLAFRALAYAEISPRLRDIRIVPTFFNDVEFRPQTKTLDVVYSVVRPQPRKRVALIEDALRSSGLFFEVLGNVGDVAYADALARAKVVVNASHHEGLNNTLCEAMLSGCVPVVSNIPGNLAAVEGGPHFVVPYGDLERLRHALLWAVYNWSEATGAAAREHIQRKYPVTARKEAFKEWMEAVL